MTNKPETVEEILKKLDPIFKQADQYQINAGYPVNTPAKEIARHYLTTLTEAHQAGDKGGYERGRKAGREEVVETQEHCQISNFKCSNHGLITPRPICPKCFPDTTGTGSQVE